MEKTRNDFWNEGIAFAKEKKWEEAIDSYQKAVELAPDAHLYTNIAECYINLDKVKEAGEFYKLAEPLLLAENYSINTDVVSYYARYLLEHEKDIKKGEKFLKMALSIKSNQKDTLENVMFFYHKAGKQEEILPIYSKFLILHSNKEIDSELKASYLEKTLKFQEERWLGKEKEKEKIFKKVLTEKSLPDPIIKVATGKQATCQYNYFYGWEDVIDELLLEHGFKWNDVEMVRLYEAAIHSQNSYYLFNAFRSIFKSEEVVYSLDKYKKMANIGKVSFWTWIKIVANNDYNLNVHNFYKELEPLLTEADIDEILKDKNVNVYNKESLVKAIVLLKKDYEKNLNSLLTAMKSGNSSDIQNQFATFLKEDDQKEFFLERFNSLVGTKKLAQKDLDKLETEIEKYINSETPTITDELLSAYKKFEAKCSKWESSFFDLFVRNTNSSAKLFKHLNFLSAKVDTYKTLYNDYELSLKTPVEVTVFEQMEERYNITRRDVISYILERVGEMGYYNDLEANFEFMADTHFDLTLDVVKEGDSKAIVLVLPTLWKKNREKTYPILLDLAKSTAKATREAVVNILNNYQEGYDDFIAMLSDKKASAREFAVNVLSTLTKNQDKILPIMIAMNETESAGDVKSALDSYLEKYAPQEDNPEKMMKNFLSQVTKDKSKMPYMFSWSKLTKLKFSLTGEELSEKEVLYLFSTFSRNKGVAPNRENRLMKNFIDNKSLANFAKYVYENWGENSKNKWALGIVSAFGDESLVMQIRKQIDYYVENMRGAMGANLVDVLAMTGTAKALQMVDQIKRKVRHKQVKGAAEKALETAAKDLEISTDELLDKIVPDFDFSKEGKRVLNFGTRQFEIAITPDLEISIKDLEKGKEIKSLPKPNANDDADLAKEATEEFKNLKKEMKVQVKLQLERLENGFSRNRVWGIDGWRELFVENPIMRRFATGLIWAFYEDKELTKLVSTFRYLEDGTFANEEDDSFVFPEKGYVGLVHPIELTEESRTNWIQQIADYEVKTPFEQLQRALYFIKEEDLEKKDLSDFKGYMISRSKLKTRLFSKGWQRGSVQDAGCYYEYYKEIPEYGIDVELSFMGDCMYDDYGDVPVYDILFYASKTVARGSYVYDRPEDGNTFTLKQIPKRLYSEIYHEIKSIMDSGTGFNPDWEKVQW